MKPVDLIIPTLGHIKKTAHPYSCFENLAALPFPVFPHIVTRGKTWAEAINIGIAQTSGENDIVLMDDDVFINDKTFALLPDNFTKADIFGFKLMFPDGRIQHAGGLVRGKIITHLGYGELDMGNFDDPLFVCHATTSLIYIKRHVISVLRGMAEDIPGIQMEDVDFSFRAIKAGFTIMNLPGTAIHLQSATKRMTPNFDGKISEAFAEIQKRHMADPEFVRTLESYPRPVTSLEVVK